MEGTGLNWRKSSYSGNGGQSCVEVASTDVVLVRDTTDRTGPVLAYSTAAWRRFADRVKRSLSPLMGEAMPQESNRITLKRDVRDRFGLRVPNLHFNDHQNYVAMREHPYAAGGSVYDAAMRRARSGSAPYPAGHNLDTARMRARPEDGHRKRVRPRAGCAEPIRVRWQRDEHRGGSERGADGSRARPTSPRRC